MKASESSFGGFVQGQVQCRRLNEVPGVRIPQSKLALRPSFALSLFASPEGRATMVDALARFIKAVGGEPAR